MNCTRERALEVLEAGLVRWEAYEPHNLTEDILDKLWDVSMYVKPGGGKNALGVYSPLLKEIYIYDHERAGRHFDAEDTVLHELAHHIMAVMYPREERQTGVHGEKWKWVCKILGCNPRASQAGEPYEDTGVPRLVEVELVPLEGK